MSQTEVLILAAVLDSNLVQLEDVLGLVVTGAGMLHPALQCLLARDVHQGCPPKARESNIPPQNQPSCLADCALCDHLQNTGCVGCVCRVCLLGRG